MSYLVLCTAKETQLLTSLDMGWEEAFMCVSLDMLSPPSHCLFYVSETL